MLDSSRHFPNGFDIAFDPFCGRTRRIFSIRSLELASPSAFAHLLGDLGR
jgi:hypothetical protein